MAKLYAELTSDKSARIVSKSGEKHLHIIVRRGNSVAYDIKVDHDILVYDHKKKRYLTVKES